MIPPQFDCHPDTIVAPLNMERLHRNEHSRSADYPHMIYDSVYVSYLLKNHGGVPKCQWFQTENGQIRRFGRLVNFGGPYFEPFQEDWECSATDIRSNWDVSSLESIGNIADGCGAFLVPFGLLYAEPHRPEEMQNVHIDLVCFDYRDRSIKVPGVVAWENGAAIQEFYACEDEGRDPWIEMRHDRFTDRVAANSTEFMLMLRENQSDLEKTV